MDFFAISTRHKYIFVPSNLGLRHAQLVFLVLILKNVLFSSFLVKKKLPQIVNLNCETSVRTKEGRG